MGLRSHSTGNRKELEVYTMRREVFYLLDPDLDRAETGLEMVYWSVCARMPPNLCVNIRDRSWMAVVPKTIISPIIPVPLPVPRISTISPNVESSRRRRCTVHRSERRRVPTVRVRLSSAQPLGLDAARSSRGRIFRFDAMQLTEYTSPLSRASSIPHSQLTSRASRISLGSLGSLANLSRSRTSRGS